mmetsp:Transcript_39477/g.130680  ORF Transcript_39477/g.130680 Transcript_39477/m.130680 type:complete len:205 (+) Transcript_39477:168-782(+)
MLPHRPQDPPPPSAGSLSPHAPLHTARAAAPNRLVGRRSPRRGGRVERQPIARERLLQARLHRGSSRTLGASSGERCLLRLLRRRRLGVAEEDGSDPLGGGNLPRHLRRVHLAQLRQRRLEVRQHLLELDGALLEEETAQRVQRVRRRLRLALVELELEAEDVRQVLRVEELDQRPVRRAGRHRLERLEHEVEDAVWVEVKVAD